MSSWDTNRESPMRPEEFPTIGDAECCRDACPFVAVDDAVDEDPTRKKLGIIVKIEISVHILYQKLNQ